VYMSDWVGEGIYNGDPYAADGTPPKNRYDDGVRAAAMAMTYQAAVTMAFSFLLPKAILPYVGIKAVYFFGNFMLGILLISTIFINEIIGATVVIALCGIPWAITMVLPFTIIGQGVDATESGLYMGALNIFVVLPQLIVAFTAGFLIDLFHHDIASALVAGGIAAIVAAGWVFYLKIPASPVIEVKESSGLRYTSVNDPEINRS
jgi:MFS family permease